MIQRLNKRERPPFQRKVQAAWEAILKQEFETEQISLDGPSPIQ